MTSKTSIPLLAWILCCLALMGSGCQHSPDSKRGSTTQVKSVARETLRTFQVTGEIVELPWDRRSVRVRHDPIPGYMPRMTMEFMVVDPTELVDREVHERIGFTLRVSADSHWIEGIHLIAKDGGRVELKEESGGVQNREFTPPPVLRVGDPMPDHAMTDETGHAISFSSFRGRPLAFTFIFTRCPLPDYCPRMSNRFREALLKLNVSGGGGCQFLSISFDPEHDRPEVLRRYASGYRDPGMKQWLFASLDSKESLWRVSDQLELRVERGVGSGNFSHNLRTVILDSEGRIVRIFAGNNWTAEELVQALRGRRD